MKRKQCLKPRWRAHFGNMLTNSLNIWASWLLNVKLEPSSIIIYSYGLSKHRNISYSVCEYSDHCVTYRPCLSQLSHTEALKRLTETRHAARVTTVDWVNKYIGTDSGFVWLENRSILFPLSATAESKKNTRQRGVKLSVFSVISHCWFEQLMDRSATHFSSHDHHRGTM